MNFENPMYYWPNLKSTFTYQNGLESKKVVLQNVFKIKLHMRQHSRCKISVSQEFHRSLPGIQTKQFVNSKSFLLPEYNSILIWKRENQTFSLFYGQILLRY